MDNHPIPQDVTGFQFKLIGNMTVRQFAYLLTGSITAWIFYSIGISPFLKLPIALFCVLGGVSLAFLPIEGRPMDTMMLRFIKALFAPNQFFYQKQGGQLAIAPVVPSKTKTPPVAPLSYADIQAYISNMPKKPKTPSTSSGQGSLDEKEMAFFNSLATYSQQIARPGGHPPSPPHKPQLISMEFEEKKEDKPQPKAQKELMQNPVAEEQELEKETVSLKKELEEAKKEELAEPPKLAEATHQKVADLEKQLAEIMSQKQQLEEQFILLSQKFQAQQVKPVFTPSTADIPVQTQHVRKIPQGMGVRIGIPVSSDNPNLIMGIVKDPRGNILPNILVEVKDKEGNPVRAFKTNNLGQFASATSLLNGVYTLEFEDPSEKNKFDTIEITADGQVIPPLEVLSTDERENLRKELFGT